MLSPEAQRKLGVTFECKKTTAEPTLTALKQAKANAYPNTIGVVAWQPRGVGGDSGVVTLDLHDFLEIVKCLSDLEEEKDEQRYDDQFEDN